MIKCVVPARWCDEIAEVRETVMWILLTYVFLPIVAILVLNWLFKRSMK